MSKSITKAIKDEVLQMVEAFNAENKTSFQISFRGQFAYLSKTERRDPSMANMFREILAKKIGRDIPQIYQQEAPAVETKLGRLKYEGQMDNWSFAVFKYSRERYDPDEFFFPGAEELNGTIEGALRAGLHIYD